MLNPSFRRIGVGVKQGGSHYYWAADFASGTAVRFTTACGGSTVRPATTTTQRKITSAPNPPPKPTSNANSTAPKPSVKIASDKTNTLVLESATTSANTKSLFPTNTTNQNPTLPTGQYNAIYFLAGVNLLVILIACWVITQPRRFLRLLQVLKVKP
jgi:hypothetical protein